LNYTIAEMPHGWHKSAAEMYLPVLQEREAAKVMSLGMRLLQCHHGLVYCALVYVSGHTHHQWHRGVSHPENLGTPPGSGQPLVTVQAM